MITFTCGILKNKFMETNNRLVVARDKGVGKIGEGGQKIPTSSYKVNKFLGCHIEHVTIGSNMYCIL